MPRRIGVPGGGGPRSTAALLAGRPLLGALRTLKTLVILGALFGVSGCAGANMPPPAQPPPRLQKSRSQATPKQAPQHPPELVAPPPAYGNKVVLASGSRATSL
ncbi:MAG TPA: hypothetical protein VI197_17130 [Polyangiaceae bacterium]